MDGLSTNQKPLTNQIAEPGLPTGQRIYTKDHTNLLHNFLEHFYIFLFGSFFKGNFRGKIYPVFSRTILVFFNYVKSALWQADTAFCVYLNSYSFIPSTRKFREIQLRERMSVGTMVILHRILKLL